MLLTKVFNRIMSSSIQKSDVVIVSAVRSPVGSYKGVLSSLSATDLGSLVAKTCIQKSGIDKGLIHEVIMGNVLSANLGQAPARQVCLKAGLMESTVCTTVNKVCASGLKAVTLASQSLTLGHSEIVLAGGTESMSNTPYYLPAKAREGLSLGNQTIIDGVLNDGLIDPKYNIHMGICGEETASKYKISREEQDAYALSSYHRAQEATKNGLFKEEIVPITVKISKTSEKTISEDEEISKIDSEKMKALKPVFLQDTGTITPANASKISDGASAILLTTFEKACSLGVKPLARVLSYADAECHPKEFTIAPTIAIPLALKRANLSLSNIALFEINEAFSVVVLANLKILGIDHAKVNIAGGAVSMGHPLGSSGCRILVSLTHLLKKGEYGCAAVCNGGGGATAIIIEKL